MAEPSASSSSSKQDKPSEDSVTLSPAQTSIIYWLAGAVPIAKALTPPFTYLGDVWKKGYDDLPKATRASRLYQSVVSDISRQTMTCTFQLASYFIAGDLIKIGLQKYFDHKKNTAIQGGADYTEQKKKDDTTRQMVLQVSSLFIQVIATIISRPFGGADLNKLLKREDYPDKKPRKGLDKFVETFINKHLRDPKSLHLLAGKTSLLATGVITVYLGSLMGLLYGFSQFMQSTFGDKNKTTPSSTKSPVNSNPTLSNPTPMSKPFAPLGNKPGNPNLNAGYGNLSSTPPNFSGYTRNSISLY